MAVLVNGNRVVLPGSGRKGEFVRWMVDRLPPPAVKPRGRPRKDVVDRERVAVVLLDGDQSPTQFSERFANLFTIEVSQ